MARDYALVRSIEELKALCGRLLADGTLLGFDIETGYDGPSAEKRALDVMHPDQYVVGFSITNSPTWARYVALRHDVGAVNLDPVEAWETVRPVLETLDVVCHQKKFEEKNLLMLEAKGDARAPIRMKVGEDTMLSAYTLSEWEGILGGGDSISSATGLKILSEQVLGVKQTKIESLFASAVTNKDLKTLRFNTLDPEDPKVVEYACADAALCLELHHKIGPAAKSAQYGFTPAGFILSLELKISQIMAEAELYGVGVDWEGMRAEREVYLRFREGMERAVKQGFAEMTGADQTALNLASPKQLAKVLYEDLALPVVLRTDKGAPSTNEEALGALAKTSAPVRKLLELRGVENLGKRHTTWLNNFTGAMDHRVHPGFAQTVVAAGRFAASDPAIQQLPKTWYWDIAMEEDVSPEEVMGRSTNGEEFWAGNFRDYIVAGEDHTLITFDYSQAELRILAGVAKEPALLEAFEKDLDVHTLTAALMLGLNPDAVTGQQRQIGKAQPLDAPILTPTGWRLMGDLEVGDEVIASDGSPTKVTGVFPQGVKPVYRVVSSDGAVAESCGEHYWTVRNKNTGKWKTLTLDQIVSSGIRTGHGRYPQAKYELPGRPVVQFAARPEPLIDPYVLGLLLGDGGFRHPTMPSFASADAELLDAVEKEVARHGGFVSSRFERAGGFWGFYIAGSDVERHGRGLNKIRDSLRDLGLWGLGSHDKFVPESYLLGSSETRLAVLQGLLDTDGCVVAGSSASFAVTSRQLALDCQELVRSLGGFASLKSRGVPEVGAGFGSSHREVWAVHLRLPGGTNPFRLRRKAERIREKQRSVAQRIVSVEGGDAREVQCISVASEDGLYVSSAYVVTHNTLNFS